MVYANEETLDKVIESSEIGTLIDYQPQNQFGMAIYKVVLDDNGNKKVETIKTYDDIMAENEEEEEEEHKKREHETDEEDEEEEDNKRARVRGGRKHKKTMRKHKGGKKTARKHKKTMRKHKGGKKTAKKSSSRKHKKTHRK